jgi:hypothetical protein
MADVGLRKRKMSHPTDVIGGMALMNLLKRKEAGVGIAERKYRLENKRKLLFTFRYTKYILAL